MRRTTATGKKILNLILSAIMMFSMVMAAPMPVNAAPSDYLSITKHEAYNKDGKFYMPFTFKNIDNYYYLDIYAKVYDSSGKVIFNWDAKRLHAGDSIRRDFNADYSGLPTGKYTFRVFAEKDNSIEYFYWDYTINRTAPEASFSFKSYETYYDSNGGYRHKFNIQCTNMKDKKLTCKIYDQNGYLVYELEGPARKTNNEVGAFTWSGYDGDYKYPSGDYTVIITASGSSKVIEKTYNLKILEKPKG